MLWIYILVIFISESRSQETGNTEIPLMKPNTTTSPPKAYVNRNEAFNLGSTVNLTCSNKTWKETLYVIWNIKLKSGECRISFSNANKSEDSCKDGKSLQNTSIGQSYLQIPNVSTKDVGVYTCESVYTGGNENYNINVTIRVPPTLSAWLERRDNKMVAVCRAERGNPAANISWSLTGSSESVKISADSDGFLTAESNLELSEDINPKNLSCIVRHQFWDQEKVLLPQSIKGQASANGTELVSNLLWIIIPIIGVLFVLLVGFSVYALKKVNPFRRCQKSNETKSPPIEDVEEVEPYASYVQRVNSIYN